MKKNISKRIASILLALSICIQNTACIQSEDATIKKEDISNSTSSSISQTIEIDPAAEDDTEDIEETLQFFLDELSKVKGIDSHIEFSDEEIQKMLEPTEVIECEDNTIWTEETLFAQIEKNSEEYAKSHPECTSVFNENYVVSYSNDSEETYYDYIIALGIKDGIRAEIDKVLKSDNKRQIHQFSNLKIIFNNSLSKDEVTTILGVYSAGIIEISLSEIKNLYKEYRDYNSKFFLMDVAKLTIMHEMNHAKEWACSDQLAKGKKQKFEIKNENFVPSLLEANAENDLYFGELKEDNPVYSFHNDNENFAYSLLKSYRNHCDFENLLICINAFDNSTSPAEFYQAIYNNDLDKIYIMLNATTNEEKILINKIIYAYDAFNGRNGYFSNMKDLYNFSDELTNKEYFQFTDSLGNIEYIDILKLALKNLILYNETNNDLTLKENLILYNFYVCKIINDSVIGDFDENHNFSDYYFYQEVYEGIKQIEELYFNYLSKRYDMNINDIYLQYYEKRNDMDWLLSFNEDITSGRNNTQIKNLLEKFSKLKTLAVPSNFYYEAMDMALNGEDYYTVDNKAYPIKLHIRHLS